MLSVSMMVDRKGSPKPLTILPRMPSVWLDDDSQSECFGCGGVFGMIRRKHHCRSCGRLFCGLCLTSGLIPQSFRMFVARYSESAVLMCKSCMKRMTMAWKTEHLMTVFACLPLQWSELMSLRMVSKHWHGAVNTLLSLWRSLLYRLDMDAFSPLERTMLSNHVTECAGHYPWAIIACVVSPKALFLSSITKHRVLCCSRHCRPEASLFDIIALIYTKSIRLLKVRKWVCCQLSRVYKVCIVDTMLWWVYLCNQYQDVAFDFFIPYCASDKYLAFSFYFCTRRSSHRKRLLELSAFHEAILHSDNMMSTLIRVLKSGRRECIQPFACPWMPWVTLVRVLHTKRIRSNSRPYLVCFETVEGMYNVMFKFESLRRDYLVSLMLMWMKRLKIGSPVFYRVFEYSNRVGCVEMVENSRTLYDIKYTLNMSLEHYIYDTNRQESVDTIRDRFLHSLVCSTVLAYVLGVGDRHLENILITDRAELVHIDFEYMFGDQPFSAVKRNVIRLTPEMVNVLGGSSSEYYARFTLKCAELFQRLRVHIPFWYRLFSWLGHHKIHHHFLQVFQHGEFDSESSYTILNTIEQRDTIVEQLFDIAHSVRIKLL